MRLIPCRAVPYHAKVGTNLNPLPGRPRLVRSGQVAGETLDVWLFEHDSPVDEDGMFGDDPSVLDEDELRRLEALDTPALKQRYLRAHVALRRLLGEALDRPARNVRIVRESCPRCGAPGGRPVLDEPGRPLFFSMSAREHLVLIGLASAPVGVDVEASPSLRAVGEASALLHPAERQELMAVDPEIRPATFTQLWCRKEAYLKGIGVGVAHGVADEYLGTRPHAIAPSGWTLLDVPVAAGFFASVALRTRAPIG